MRKKKTSNPGNDGCYDCDNCCYIGEGDYICDIHGEIVMCEWEPTKDFYCCEGKEHTPI